MAGVGLALAIAELGSSMIDGVPSLVTTVSSYVIPFVPPAVEDVVIGLFGTSDKAVLAAGTVTSSLLIGAVAGILGHRDRNNATVLFAAFGMLGILAAVARPLTAPIAAIVVTVAATVAGRAALGRLLTHLGPASVPAPSEVGAPTSVGASTLDRRRFVTALVGVGAAAAVMATVARNAMRPPPVDIDEVALPAPSRTLPDVAPTASFDIAGLTPIHVPNDDFYRIDTALSVPRIDPDEWSLRIHGMVDREVVLGYQDILGMSLTEHDATIACVSNEVGGRLVGNARWLGVPLREILDTAGVRDGATQIVGRAIDGWTAGFPTELAFDGREALLAVGMNGAALPAAHGFPARLIIPGLYGYVSATKWLTEIELTTWEAFDAYWVPRGWAKEGPIKTQSRIDVPRPDSRVQPGRTVVAGVAWAPTRGVESVEVRVDEGAWHSCELSEPLHEDAWVQWRTEIDLAPGRHRIQVRATDATGRTQSQTPVPPRPDGAEGWHEIRVNA
jgi:DMSO/TMAO reductase YedYZ molybdopterin-dependent catalytic subunit